MVKDMLEALVNLPGFSVRVNTDDEDGFEVTSQVPSQWEPAWGQYRSDSGTSWPATPTLAGGSAPGCLSPVQFENQPTPCPVKTAA